MNPLLTLALASLSVQSMFTSAERDRALAAWRTPGRYAVEVPKSHPQEGLWQPRLTVAGSTWFLNYNRARGLRTPPTQIPGPQNEEERIWEEWLEKKVAYDQARAALRAQALNQSVLRGPAAESLEPVWPGPPPPGLIALAGNPPDFAEAVVPLQHTVRFEDGLEVTYQDNVRMRPRYAYYRFAHGAMSAGTPVRSLPASTLDRLFQLAGASPFEAKVMRAVSNLEGGFDSINTYDTGFVSVGFIQFATLRDGANSLGAMLLDHKQTSPTAFEADFRSFGVDVSPLGVLAVLDLETGVELTGADAVQQVIRDKRLIAVFQRAGLKSELYNAAQIRAAKRLFYPGDDPASVTIAGRTLTGKIKDIVKSEAGMATLMDRKVNTGRLDPLPQVLAEVAEQRKISFFLDLAKHEREIVEKMRYRKDYLADPQLSKPK